MRILDRRQWLEEALLKIRLALRVLKRTVRQIHVGLANSSTKAKALLEVMYRAQLARVYSGHGRGCHSPKYKTPASHQPLSRSAHGPGRRTRRLMFPGARYLPCLHGTASA